MSDLYWLTDEQMTRLQPYFPKSHGKPRVDDRRVLSGIVFVNRNRLRWCDAPSAYGPHKTLYNRWKRWGERGVFLRMMEGLAAAEAVPKTVMIDATYLKAQILDHMRLDAGIADQPKGVAGRAALGIMIDDNIDGHRASFQQQGASSAMSGAHSSGEPAQQSLTRNTVSARRPPKSAR